MRFWGSGQGQGGKDSQEGATHILLSHFCDPDVLTYLDGALKVVTATHWPFLSLCCPVVLDPGFLHAALTLKLFTGCVSSSQQAEPPSSVQ